MSELTKYPIRNLFRGNVRKRKGDTRMTLSPKYKCNSCKTMNIPLNAMNPAENGYPKTCPKCLARAIVEQCPNDKVCTCSGGVHAGVTFCSQCGNAICPSCGSHDVSAISRITGYMSDVSGWGAGKAQELKERKHYDIYDATPVT